MTGWTQGYISDSLTLECVWRSVFNAVFVSKSDFFLNWARLLSLLGSGLEGRGRDCEDAGDSPASRCLELAFRVLRPLADGLGRILSRCVYNFLYTRGGIGGRGSIVGRSSVILSLPRLQMISV